MKTITYLLGLIALIALTLTTGCASMQRSDATVLQGTWKGHELNSDDVGTFVVSGDAFEFRGSDPRVWYKGTFILHEDKQPKQFVAHIADTGIPQYVGKDAIAIYKIEGKTLTIAADEPGVEGAPTSFDAAGAACFVMQKE